ncbi:hypothetical protein KIN20_015436, partial [Parelaphostrongylus tenuis]
MSALYDPVDEDDSMCSYVPCTSALASLQSSETSFVPSAALEDVDEKENSISSGFFHVDKRSKHFSRTQEGHNVALVPRFPERHDLSYDYCKFLEEENPGPSSSDGPKVQLGRRYYEQHRKTQETSFIPSVASEDVDEKENLISSGFFHVDKRSKHFSRT